MLTVQRRGPVVEVQLDRPDVRNAFAPPMIEALTMWARQAGDDPATRVVVLSGAGATFCAGADLRWMREMRHSDEATNVDDASRLADMFEALAAVPCPVVARVQGAAIGGGAGLLAVCDHVVAADDTRIAFPEVRIGLLPAVIAPYVGRRIGWAACRSLFLTGRRVTAIEGQRLGLVHDVVAADALDTAVAQVVDEMLSGASSAQRATKALLARLEPRDVAGRALTVAAIAAQRVTPEGQEGLSAFLERREPAWRTPTPDAS